MYESSHCRYMRVVQYLYKPVSRRSNTSTSHVIIRTKVTLVFLMGILYTPLKYYYSTAILYGQIQGCRLLCLGRDYMISLTQKPRVAG